MKKRSIILRFIPLIIVGWMGISQSLYAQQVTGDVTDAQTGEPLAGVNILVIGTSSGTATDAKGHYSLSVPSLQDSLRFSFIGYQTKRILIDGRSTINVALKSKVISGQQLVVTALGIKQQKRELAYSAQEVKTQPLTVNPTINLVNSLEGIVPGLSVSQSGGGIGSPSRVILRGNRSISGNNKPLYIIDGIPTLGNPRYLTSNNIASINVIKGPNGAALYGADAQNGAIIITTKKGGNNGLKVSLNNSFIFNRAIVALPYQNKYGRGANGQFILNANASWGPLMKGQTVSNWSKAPGAEKEYRLIPQPNLVKSFFQTGYNLSHNLQLSYGSKSVSNIVSVASTEGRGVIPANNLERTNIYERATGNFMSDKFQWDGMVSFTHQKIKNMPGQNYTNYNPMYTLLSLPRSLRIKDIRAYGYRGPDGLLQQNFWGGGTGTSTIDENPYWVAYNIDQYNKINRVTAVASLTYNFTHALSLMGRVSYDQILSSMENKIPNFTRIRAPNGEYQVSKSNSYNFNANFLLSYKKELSKMWNVSIRAGGNIKKELTGQELSAGTGTALLIPDFFAITNTNNPVINYDPGAPLTVQSLYALGKIGWNNSIFLSLTGRNDWSSTLPKNSRSYFYPSIGLSAIISNMISSFPKFIDFLKLRASYAKVGVSAEPFQLSRSATFIRGGSNGFLQLSSVLPNTKLKPTQTKSYEGGINIRFVNGRLGLSLTYFRTNSVNQLFKVSLPVTSGASSFFTNGGNVLNKGVEMEINSTPIRSNRFSWNVGVNFSHLKNIVLKISDQRPKIIVSGPASHYYGNYELQQGKPFGLLVTQGFKRDDKGRVITEDGLPVPGNDVTVGPSTPDWQGAIFNTFSYRNWRLTFQISHTQGGIIGSSTRERLLANGLLKETLKGRNGGLIFGKNIFTNITAVTQDGKPNTTSITAEQLWNSLPTAVFAYSTTNTRLKKATLSYTLPESVLKNSPLSKIMISLVGRNLLFIHRVTPGLVPNTFVGTTKQGSAFSSFPTPTVRSFGLNVRVSFQ
jgi:TonB-linked SusC/RagA family outer membrane protein